MHLLSLEEQLQAAMQKKIDRKRHELAIYIERMKGVSPLQKLNSGYSYVVDDQGKNIRSISQVKIGEPIKIYVTDGCVNAQVQEVLEEKRI
jgi:exodeoxyribonuclease VII large subunit